MSHEDSQGARPLAAPLGTAQGRVSVQENLSNVGQDAPGIPGGNSRCRKGNWEIGHPVNRRGPFCNGRYGRKQRMAMNTCDNNERPLSEEILEYLRQRGLL